MKALTLWLAAALLLTLSKPTYEVTHPPGPEQGRPGQGQQPVRRCEGCRFRSREGGGYRRGLKIEISKAWQSKVLVGLAGSLGANGNCRIGGRCFAWKDCRWVTYALLFNASTEDLWFATDRWFIPLPYPGALVPGKNGWLRIPSGRSALYLAGPYKLGCDNALGSKELRLYKGKTKTYIGRIRWSARCSPCTWRDQVTPPLK